MHRHMTTTALLAASLAAGAAQAENRIDQQLPNAPELAAYGDHAVRW